MYGSNKILSPKKSADQKVQKQLTLMIRKMMLKQKNKKLNLRMKILLAMMIELKIILKKKQNKKWNLRMNILSIPCYLFTKQNDNIVFFKVMVEKCFC